MVITITIPPERLRKDLPVEANIGPTALASAPRDLKIPITVPFCSTVPYDEIIVVRHGTTVADAKNKFVIT